MSSHLPSGSLVTAVGGQWHFVKGFGRKKKQGRSLKNTVHFICDVEVVRKKLHYLRRCCHHQHRHRCLLCFTHKKQWCSRQSSSYIWVQIECGQ